MTLTSISKIRNVYDTGQKPVLAECNDLEAYVCKHNQGQTIAYTLFAEWIAYHFLKMLEVEIPSQALVKIKEDHVEPTQICQPAFFKETTCFATKHMEHAVEWNRFSLGKKKIANKKDLLKIAWLDLWLANEDRNENNFNILSYPAANGIHILPIDHGACFNSLGFSCDRPLYQIEYFESIIASDHFRSLHKNTFSSMVKAKAYFKKLYLCIENLGDIYDEIVSEIPGDWRIPKDYIDCLKQNLFDKYWLEETKNSYLSYLESGLDLK